MVAAFDYEEDPMNLVKRVPLPAGWQKSIRIARTTSYARCSLRLVASTLRRLGRVCVPHRLGCSRVARVRAARVFLHRYETAPSGGADTADAGVLEDLGAGVGAAPMVAAVARRPGAFPCRPAAASGFR